MKPRLIHVLRTLHMGGTEVQVLNLLPHLRDRFDVSVVCLHDRGTLAPDLERFEIPVEVVRFKNRWSPVPMWRLRSLFLRERVDIVQTHLYGPSISAIAAARLAEVPVRISTVHDMDHWRLGRRLRTDKALMRWRTAVFCVSDPVRRVYLERTGCPPSMCRTIHNGIRLEDFRMTRSRESVRAEFGISPGQPVVGMVANLVPIKNHRGFLDAATVIREERPDAVFLLVGDGVMREELTDYAASLGLDQAVRFAGVRRDVPDLLGAMDCFLLTSHREAFSIATLESMAMGVPVVATDQGGVGDIIRPPEEGFLVDPRDPEGMARAALRILGDPGLSGSLSARGKERAREFSMDRIADRTAAAYMDLLAASSRTAALAAGSG